MGRPKVLNDDELLDILARIEIQYGFLSIATIQKAHTETPFEIPASRTFKRRLGGLRHFNTPDFRDKLKPYLDKLKQK